MSAGDTLCEAEMGGDVHSPQVDLSVGSAQNRSMEIAEKLTPAAAVSTVAVANLEDIEAVLAELWDAEESVLGDDDITGRAQVRVCLGNLIVITPGPMQGKSKVSMSEVTVRLGARVPLRVIVVEIDPDQASPGIRASVKAVCRLPSPGEPQICCEQIVLRCGHADREHLPGVILPLLERDLPSFVWWDDEPDLDDAVLDRLLRADSRLIFDLDHVKDFSCLPQLRKRLARLIVHDLAWARIEPWRRELARIFDDPFMLDQLQSLDAICIQTAAAPGRGVSAEGLLFAGWLAAQLALETVSMANAASAAPGLTAGADGDFHIDLIRAGRPLKLTLQSTPSATPAPTPAASPQSGEASAESSAGAGDGWPAEPPCEPPLYLVELRGAKDAGGMVVTLCCPEPDGTIDISVSMDRSCPLPRRVSARSSSPAHLIGDIVEHDRATDPVYLRALGQAAALAPASPG